MKTLAACLLAVLMCGPVLAADFVIKEPSALSMDVFSNEPNALGYAADANAEIIRLRTENAALRAALAAKIGKTEAQLTAELYYANRRAAKAEGELIKIKSEAEAAAASNPFDAAPSSPGWKEIGRFSGNGKTTTPKFTVSDGKEWRLRWVADADFYVYAQHPKSTSYTESFTSKGATDKGIGYLYESPGEFYLKTMCSGSWQVFVEEK